LMGAVDRDPIGALRSNFWPRRPQSRNEPVRSQAKSSCLTPFSVDRGASRTMRSPRGATSRRRDQRRLRARCH
jgi:hypothetical protein